ncbi:hypothetical protein GPECTOR_105g104 [Gonium pectorale]|uniref:SPX domain-containing protein n=1 Tax=Gonium pectorale TaxID=33097 RepID=A0A150G176_GONPE|nr:hypothetical protein GPECTOR_105g104 [Gonium pectorale]|eukprot:KXZ43050.1 hypothetical protein GPECTOR_105g104 [Gonium pectorale]
MQICKPTPSRIGATWPQALVADYQYTLRMYRALRKQIGEWRDGYRAVHRRQPTVEDAAQACGAEFALLYSTFLEVRKRLMVELPRLRARLQQEGVAAGGEGGGSQGRHHGRGAPNDAASVNANVNPSGLAGLAGGAQPHPHPQPQQQVVDSVGTWLRADRYRRQRAVAAAAMAAASPQAPSAPVASVPVDAGGGASPLPAAAVSAAQAWPGPDAATEEAGSGAASAAARSGQLLGDGEAMARGGDAPYQPVIQLIPLEERLRAAAGAAGALTYTRGNGQK